MLIWILFSFLLASTASSEELSRPELEKKVLFNIYVQSKFHSYVRPQKNDSDLDIPAVVTVNLYILHLGVDTKKQQFDMSFYFRQEWNDSRLAYNSQGKLEYITAHDVIGFWTPDLFFVQEANAQLHAITKPNTFAKIYPEGRVLYSQRLSVTSTCPMDLRRYPFDRQTCRLRIESYGYTADDLLLQWKDGDQLPPVTGTPEVIGYEAGYSYTSSIATFGENRYSVAELDIHLRRHITDFFLHIYVPITVFVLISWVTFWLKPSGYLIRLTVSLTMLFVTMVQLNINGGLFVSPGYPTALDAWIAICCALLFFALLENTYVAYAFHTGDYALDSSRERASVTSKDCGNSRAAPLVDVLSKLASKKSIDVTARILFPSVFILFHVLYIVYLASDSFSR